MPRVGDRRQPGCLTAGSAVVWLHRLWDAEAASPGGKPCMGSLRLRWSAAQGLVHPTAACPSPRFSLLAHILNTLLHPHTAGPEPVAAAFYSLGAVDPPWPKDEKEGGPEWYKWAANGTHTWQGSTLKVYRLGQWYTPCWFSEQHCHLEQAEKRKTGGWVLGACCHWAL